MSLLPLAPLALFAVAAFALHKSSGAGRSPCPRPAPVFCECADPTLDSMGQCGACFRKPRSEMNL